MSTKLKYNNEPWMDVKNVTQLQEHKLCEAKHLKQKKKLIKLGRLICIQLN